MNKLLNLKIRLAIAAFLMVIGSALLISGFIVPPLGIIDNSVLVAFGEVCTFVGALVGIDFNYKLKMYESQNKGKRG